MNFNLDVLNSTSNTRKPVFARNVVATSQPLAAQAGLEILRRGGNAVDVELSAFGRGQIIWRLPSGAYMAGSVNRTDGCAAGY